jgi:hypothetical protein
MNIDSHGADNNIYFIELKHTIQLQVKYKETAQLDTKKGIARTDPASKKKKIQKQYINIQIKLLL